MKSAGDDARDELGWVLSRMGGNMKGALSQALAPLHKAEMGRMLLCFMLCVSLVPLLPCDFCLATFALRLLPCDFALRFELHFRRTLSRSFSVL